MKIPLALVILTATAASAAPPEVRIPRHNDIEPVNDSWVLEMYLKDTGEILKIGDFKSEHECKEAIAKYEAKQHGYDGKCVKFKLPKGE